MPDVGVEVAAFAQVGKGHDVSGVGGGSVLVGHPHFHAVDGDAALYVGQAFHPTRVVVAEVVSQEEVAVGFIVVPLNFKGCELCAALRGDRLGHRFLLRGYGLQFQFAELQVGANTEERTGTLYQTIVRRHGDVTAFQEFYNLIFLALILQFEAFRVEAEGRFGVVIEVHLHLVTDFALYAEVDGFVEIKSEGLALSDGQAWVVDAFHVGTDFQAGASLCLDLHAARSEYFFGRSEVEVHVGEVECLLVTVLVFLGVLLAVEGPHGLLQTPFVVFFGRHQEGGVQIVVANLRA